MRTRGSHRRCLCSPHGLVLHVINRARLRNTLPIHPPEQTISSRYGTSSQCQTQMGVSPWRNISEQKENFLQLGLHLFCSFSMFFHLHPALFFSLFPFLTGLSLQTSPNFHKERNCFQVGIKQTRSLEKIKNNEFLSVGLLARPSLLLPPFISLQKKKNKSLLIPLEPCLQIHLRCML